MSIEETNALRISLGLKPLNSSSRKEVVLVDTSNGASNSQEAVQERLNKAKARREEKDKANRITTKALSSNTKGDVQGSAKDWVNSSRKNASKNSNDQKARVSAAKKRDECVKNAVYTDDQMSGIKVGHNMADFEEGESVILTLGDESILEAGTNGLYKGLKEVSESGAYEEQTREMRAEMGSHCSTPSFFAARAPRLPTANFRRRF